MEPAAPACSAGCFGPYRPRWPALEPPESFSPFEVCLSASGAWLYRAKVEGRNRVVAETRSVAEWAVTTDFAPVTPSAPG
jgi:hypothetical protein